MTPPGCAAIGHLDGYGALLAGAGDTESENKNTGFRG